MRLSLLFLTRFSVRPLGLLILLSTGLLAQAQTIRYVKPTATNTGSGNSWLNASGNLQAMINASAPGDQVWVATGTYKPTSTNDRTISFSMRADVAIYGGFVGTETTLGARGAVNPITGNPSSTTLSGDIGVAGNADNSYHVIRNSSGLTTSAILDGFVITGGNANGDYSGPYDNGSGGGMINAVTGGIYFANCSPLIRNCSFQANSASSGGAMANDAYNHNSESSPTLINCSFQGNTASSGGAIYNDAAQNSDPTGPPAESSPTLTNCSFKANTASKSGGAMESYAFGSRAYSSPTLTNCSFEGNTITNTSGSSQGGAMSNNSTQAGFCSPTLTNCSFLNNSALGGISYGRGGAIHNDGRESTTIITLNNCSFQGNTASADGGAIYSSGSFTGGSIIRNVTFMTNCVLFGNGGAKTFYNGGARVYTKYTMLETSVTNYIPSSTDLTASTSPFTSPTSVALTANSPAIDAGDPETTNAGQTDLAGNSRIVRCRIDMGALEFQNVNIPPTITGGPASGSVVCAGSGVTVPVSVSGTVQGYQWYKDSFANPVAGQTTATLTLSNLQPGNAGSYSLVVTGFCNSLTTTAFSLSVNSLPPVSISPGSATLCQGQSVLLTASGASTGETLSYTWSNNTTGNTLSATTAGTYSVTGVDGNGCANTATATITENKPPVSISPGSVSICQGQSALLTASGASTYTWSNNTTGNTLIATTAGTYSVTGVDGNGCSQYSHGHRNDVQPYCQHQSRLGHHLSGPVGFTDRQRSQHR